MSRLGLAVKRLVFPTHIIKFRQIVLPRILVQLTCFYGSSFLGIAGVKLPRIWRKPLGAFIITLWTDREILRTTFRDGPPSPFSSAYSSQISSISEICNSLLKLSSAYQMPILGPGKGSCAVENDGRACSRSIAFKLYSTPTVRATLCI